jgi:hypothetical protein
MRMALIFYSYAAIPFSRRCLKETEQYNTENDNLITHILYFQVVNIMIKIINKKNAEILC